jgi:hypothetical protein
MVGVSSEIRIQYIPNETLQRYLCAKPLCEKNKDPYSYLYILGSNFMYILYLIIRVWKVAYLIDVDWRHDREGEVGVRFFAHRSQGDASLMWNLHLRCLRWNPLCIVFFIIQLFYNALSVHKFM